MRYKVIWGLALLVLICVSISLCIENESGRTTGVPRESSGLASHTVVVNAMTNNTLGYEELARSNAAAPESRANGDEDELIKITKQRIPMDKRLLTLCVGPQAVIGPHAAAEVDVFVNSKVIDYRRRHTDEFAYPVGSKFVKKKYPKVGAKVADVATVMLKKTATGKVADWEFRTIRLSDGKTITPRLRTSCATCHQRYKARGYISSQSEQALQVFLRSTEKGSAEKEGAEKASSLSTIREFKAKGFQVRLDLRPQELRLRVPTDLSWNFEKSGRVEAPIAATLGELGAHGFVSASMLAQKAKQFDDGLYAAVELAAQRGQGSFEGKAALLRRLAETLHSDANPSSSNAPHVIWAAAQLGNLKPSIPPSQEKGVQELLTEFQANSLRSKPIGFYNWNDSLSAIFQQDRMLQTELRGRAGTEAVVRALAADPKSQATYESYLQLVSQLTNPLAKKDLRSHIAEANRDSLQAPAEKVHFFPPSRSHESDLVMKLYGGRSIPEGFDLMEEMVARIRSGKLDLQPSKQSGWYDYQTWALEPLVAPEKTREASKLILEKSYRQQLVALFKGLLTLTRETHIKQIEIPAPGAAPPPLRPVIHISPKLSAEPLATFYARRSQSYRFVRSVLERAFGKETLRNLHRLTPDGPVNANLDSELTAIEALFRSAHLTVCRDLGLPPAPAYAARSSQQLQQDTAAFAKFARMMKADPDLGRDARTMVPVFFDIERKKTKVWVFLGWSTRPVEIDFAKRPSVTVLDAQGKPAEGEKGPILRFVGATQAIAYPVMAEVYVSKILNRKEFQQHCNKYKTQKKILDNLE